MRPAPERSRLPALLWDIDGTLIDTTHLVVGGLDHVFTRFLGRSLPEPDLRALVGIPLARQVRWLGDPAAAGASAEQMEAEFIRWWEERKHEERVIPQAVDVLVRASRAGHGTALVTSKNLVEVGNTLPRLGIAEHVDLVVSADDVTHPKPDPEGIRLAAERLGVAPSCAVYIGDTIHDMQAGAGAGVRRCAVTWGAGVLQALRAENPDVVCTDPGDLWAALGL